MEGALNLGRIAGKWGALFNGALSLHTSPEALSAGTLTVNVDSPAWLHQASFMRQQMLLKLREFGVTSIRFRQGPVVPPESSAVSVPEKHEVSHEEKAEVEAMLVSIEDEALRGAIRGAALLSFSRDTKGGGTGRKDVRKPINP